LSVFFRRKKRKYGDVKPPVKTRGSLLDWLSPRTREAQRFIRTPELMPIGGRWGGRSLGQYSVGAVTPFIANPPSFASIAPAAQAQAPAAQAPVSAPVLGAPSGGGGVQAQLQPTGAGPIVAPGVAGTRTYTVGGRTYTQAPTPFPTYVSGRVAVPGGRPLGG